MNFAVRLSKAWPNSLDNEFYEMLPEVHSYQQNAEKQAMRSLTMHGPATHSPVVVRAAVIDMDTGSCVARWDRTVVRVL